MRNKRVIIPIITLLVIGLSALLAVILAKGYTFSTQQGRLVGTGIISVSSLPTGASVYVDGHLTTATDTTISSLPPKSYKIKIAKEGFVDWEKEIEVKEGLVAEINATLFPSLPTIYPLTYNGAVNPILSPDNQHIAFAVPLINDQHARQKGGVWVWTFETTPIAFTRGSQPHQLIASTSSLDFSKATFRFSPDSQQLLVTLQENDQPGEANQRNYLLDVNSTTTVSNLSDITPQISTTLKSWGDDQKAADKAKIDSLTDIKVRNIASSSASLKWSPDETKFMYSQKVSDPMKVYNLETDKTHDLPQALSYQWLADSEHVVLVQDDPAEKSNTTGRVSVMDYDGTNQVVMFSGIFDKKSVFPWSDNSKVVILSSFPNPTASILNLFGINLK
jgi:hypothetical protein